MTCRQCGRSNCGCLAVAKPGSRDDWLGCSLVLAAPLAATLGALFVGARTVTRRAPEGGTQ